LLYQHTTGFSHHSTAAWQTHSTSNSSNTANHHHSSIAHYHSTAKGSLHTDAAAAAASATAAANSSALYPTDSSVRIPVKVEQLPGCVQQLQQQGDTPPAGSVSASSNGVWGGAGLQLLMKLPWNMEVCKVLVLELVLELVL
jgi:hypothetical protein